MTTFQRTVPFKGGRDYLQGPDLFDTALECLSGSGEITDITFAAHSFIHSNVLRITVLDRAESPLPAVPAMLSCLVHEEKKWVLFEEGVALDVSLRKPFDEGFTTENVAVAGDVAALQVTSPWTMIETLVSMKKHLLMAMFPTLTCKWVFVRAELTRTVMPVEEAEVRCATRSPSRIYQSQVRVNGADFGKIYFVGIEQ